MSSSSSPPFLTYPLLLRQNACTTTAIQNHLTCSPAFLTLSQREGESIKSRDEEDDHKLHLGIELAKNKGVLDRNHHPEPYQEIFVDDKTPEEVSDEILSHCEGVSSSNRSFVIILCGLSGTGKGTTVSQLQSKLCQDHQRDVSCWSNGNIFRAVTLLITTWCEQHQKPLEEGLTEDNLRNFMQMLRFEKGKDGVWDTVINGLGFEDVHVLDVQNTLLKQPEISKNIPTVAKETQGEVIAFASEAIRKMVSEEEGVVVLLEGRMQTVDFFESKNRFCLKMKDDSVLGKRRAAQRLMGCLMERVVEDCQKEEIERILKEELEKMVKELND